MTDLSPTERFTNRAEDYRRHRPGYPPGVLELMRATCGLEPPCAIADVGAGTGILSRLLLEAGYEVTAVEPNAAMRAAAEEDLRAFPLFRSVAAMAEQTGLPAASFAAITVAQAFHWFTPVAARREFQRLLRPGGWVFLVRNERQVDSTPFTRGYEALLATLGEPYRAVLLRDQFSRQRNENAFFASAAVVDRACFENPHVLDWPGLVGRFFSSSYTPAPGDPRRADYLVRLEELFHAHAQDGCVVLDQLTEVSYAQL